MKTITKYQCEICQRTHESEDAALKCESRGLPDYSKIPIGWMFEYHHNGYVGIFCVGRTYPSNDVHFLSDSLWAIRVYPYPRYTLDEEYCSGNSYISTDADNMKWIIKHRVITPDKVGSLEFAEMVKYLKQRRIIPFYYTPEGVKVMV